MVQSNLWKLKTCTQIQYIFHFAFFVDNITIHSVLEQDNGIAKIW